MTVIKTSLMLLIITLNISVLKAQRIYSDSILKRYDLEKPNKKYFYFLKSDRFKRKYPNTVKVDSVTTYFQSEVVNNYTGKFNRFKYIRLFPDGRFFMSFDYYSFPDPSQICDYSYGKYGFYSIIDSHIVLEIYYNREYGIIIYNCLLNEETIKVVGISYGIGRTWGSIVKYKSRNNEPIMKKIKCKCPLPQEL